MCGIFGFIGNKQVDATSIVQLALCDLEYRGYDSWGIATMTDAGIVIKKAIGKISDVGTHELKRILSNMSIGHSRWATHGGVTEVNSHPHFNRAKTIAVVHNGIVENHIELREFLVQRLRVSVDKLFISETDTEVIPHLIDYFIGSGKTFEEAFIETGKMLSGRYAFVAMKEGEQYLLAMRDGSPLVVGRGDGGYYLASDVPAFLDYTRTVSYPGDHDFMRISHDSILMHNLKDGRVVDPTWDQVTWDKGSATKDGHPHFMLKEILEQPKAIGNAICQENKKLHAIGTAMMSARDLIFIGCGTAAKMAKLGELYTATIAHKLSRTHIGSEFGVYEQFVDSDTLLFAVSQSGETADVLEALCAGKKKNAAIYSLLNVVGSSINRMSKNALFINTGPEIAVASTKAATAQMAVLLLLAFAQAGKLAEGKLLMRAVVKKLHSWVNIGLSCDMQKIAEKLYAGNTFPRDRAKEMLHDIYIIGRGLSAPIAEEAAIKIQEVSYIHAEGFDGGELKHGPIALIEKGTPVIALIPNDETFTDMQSNTTELKSRGAYVIGIGPKMSELFDEWVPTPDLGLASPAASIIPIQLLAYHLAVLAGNDPDKPRNLAKSVTVK